MKVAPPPPPIPVKPAVGCRFTAAHPLDWTAAQDLADRASANCGNLVAVYQAFNDLMEKEVLDVVGESISDSPATGNRGREHKIVS